MQWHQLDVREFFLICVRLGLAAIPDRVQLGSGRPRRYIRFEPADQVDQTV